MNDFQCTAQKLPPDNTLVETMNSKGNIQILKYHHGLWFFPDMSMYVYYTPKFWRLKK